MKRMHVWLAATGMSICGGFVQAQSAEGDETAEPPASQHLVCRKEYVTGSRIPQEVCRYPSQIKAERANARKYIRDSYEIDRRGASVTGGKP